MAFAQATSLPCAPAPRSTLFRPGAWDQAGFTKARVIGQASSRISKKLIHSNGGEWAVLADVVEDIGTVSLCSSCPEDLHAPVVPALASSFARLSAKPSSTSSALA
jgi:hypothetical protein